MSQVWWWTSATGKTVLTETGILYMSTFYVHISNVLTLQYVYCVVYLVQLRRKKLNIRKRQLDQKRTDLRPKKTVH